MLDFSLPPFNVDENHVESKLKATITVIIKRNHQRVPQFQ